MANQDTPIWERLGTDHDISPPWTSLNIVKAIKAGLFAQPSPQCIRDENTAYQIVNNGLTFQEKSRVPNACKGAQLVIIPAARAANHKVTAILEEHKLFFNPSIIVLMFM